jgi:hypothetical protein
MSARSPGAAKRNPGLPLAKLHQLTGSGEQCGMAVNAAPLIPNYAMARRRRA